MLLLTILHKQKDNDVNKHLSSIAQTAQIKLNMLLLRSCDLHYRLALLWPFHMLGMKSESESIYIQFFDHYQESIENPLTEIKVQLSNADVQLYAAWLVISPQLKGLQWIMHNWFYTSAAVGMYLNYIHTYIYTLQHIHTRCGMHYFCA
jgi:Putative adipose-regulatory protein (Seipin)